MSNDIITKILQPSWKEILYLFPERPAIVYCFTNLINGKLYIGTSIDFISRLYKHIRESKKIENNNKFYNSIRKYGWDNFELHFLQVCLTQKGGLIREKQWIQYLDSYKNGLNSTEGGEGGGSGEESIFAKGIKGINIDTYEEYEWKWIKGAAKYFNTNWQNISIILSGRNKQLYTLDGSRFTFKYIDDYSDWDLNIPQQKEVNEVSIIAYDKYNNIIGRYKSLSEASQITGADKRNISDSIHHKVWYVNNIRWEYEDINKRNKQISRTPLKKPDKIGVYYYKNGEKIEFRSCREAARIISPDMNEVVRAREIKKSFLNEMPDSWNVQWFKIM
ncbi:GIY-YIG catalytic domain-containing endonuclease [Paramecium bursaria Chlorella virus CVR-1]|uniref:GIY-YIG catalytic domain-containing endonuclease n=1 Tax=Paramecium bursaria Chlorella virus CVA-1 TaxID=42683 RepID=M1HJM5_9PHYC|nr:homing endonuclease [Paramecium bursaria Chlorella virus CVA-1]AGE50384.1 GIY-YIG catalytic domain-containing endonuclease [Paramecium bursaria Chlorella virus CVA-1]AGE52061.1 GIY-YIG catalytic domain-containing endonuclease [Paramecium bursaria Chlorella virus CVR-1]